MTREVIQEKKARGREGEDLVPTLAELMLTKEELRRLRREGIRIKKKMKLGKAGITEGIVNGVHERWRNSELVKIACDDICRLNMKRTHDLLERKTGGLVIWRSGGNIILYRGTNYKYPYFSLDNGATNDSSDTVLPKLTMDSEVGGEEEKSSSDADVTKSPIPNLPKPVPQPQLIQGVGSLDRVRFRLPGEAQLTEEADRLLHGLGPRYSDWWGYEPLPVDADLLPATVPGYRRPFRLLPYGVKNTLTNDEMTILKRLGRPLPCHFVLGRNRKHQGLAVAMVKLWEKCEIAKIAVKRGVQNTNSELMAEELKRLTGGTLLSRDKEFMVFYRGKDFLPAAVSAAIEERRRAGAAVKENRTGSKSFITTTQGREHFPEDEDNIKDKGVNMVSFKKKPITIETAIEKTVDKLKMAIEKKTEAEKLLTELEEGEIKQESEIDKEGITEEERYMLRKVGLRMKPFLLLGRRGVFDGTVENMHLHWKYRELVKVICGGRNIEEVHIKARTLEAESGGILVAVERVSKGYAIIVYRGKNYERPACLRPRTLLTKRQALKRSIEAQRRESLKLHVLKLNKRVDDLKIQLGRDQKKKIMLSSKESSPQLAEEGCGADPISSNSDGSYNALVGDQAINSQNIEGLLDLNEDEEGNSEIAEPEATSELEIKHTKDLVSMNAQHGDAESATCINNRELQNETNLLHAIDTEPDGCDKDASAELPNYGTDAAGQVTTQNTLCRVPFRAARLSNRDRLLLRKKALKMKKRPVLAVGRSNIISGVAKTIMTHFQKYPLAIVNVKGRAKGTSVQEVVFKLEQATGAVLVSQEPSKVILYRGWGGNVEPGQCEKNKHEQIGTSAGIISPELMSAIRLECGLQKGLDT